jgi:hypothetical protein
MFVGAIVAVALLAGCSEPAATNNAAANVATPEPNPAASPSGWAGLRNDIGKYPRDIGLFETSAIGDDLQALLGDDFDTFKTNMEVQGSLTEEDGVLWVSGNKPHQGGDEAAYLLIDPAAEQLEVGLWHDGRFRTFTTPGAAIAKPVDVRTMIANAPEAP